MHKLLVVLLTLLPVALGAQTIRVEKVAIPGTIMAVTDCRRDGDFVIELDTTQTPGVDSAQALTMRNLALVHELKHVGQILMLGCAAADSIYDVNPDFRLLAELDAYCAEAQVQVLNGERPTNPFPDDLTPFDIYMFLGYGRGRIDLDSTRTIIKNRCPDLVGL